MPEVPGLRLGRELRSKYYRAYSELLKLLTDVWTHPALSLNAKSLWQYLMLHVNRKSGLCCPSYELISLDLRIGKSSISKAIRELQSHTMLLVEKKKPRFSGGRPFNAYTPLGPRCVKRRKKPAPPEHEKVVHVNFGQDPISTRSIS